MIVAYYTNEDGNIVRHHKVKDDMNPLALQELVADYNKKNRDKVRVKEIEEGSLEAYLFDLANKKLCWRKEDIQDALDALQEAQRTIETLAEEM